MSGAGPAKLGRLAKAVEGAVLEGAASTEVGLLEYDSRRVRPGALFFALRGANADGCAYLEEAARRGAVAAVCEKGVRVPKGLAAVRVADARRAMADVAAEFYGHPTRRLKVVGVTGTNGKTTTTHMVRDVLRGAGVRTALVGTIRYEYGGRLLAASRTTPESADLQRMFAECLEAGEEAAAIEASSQGLAAERLRGTRFAAAAFTNLTPDHLDSHRTMEAYYLAKRRLFDALGDGALAATNLDDEYGRRLAADPALAGRVVGYGTGPEAEVRASGAKISETGSEFLAETPWGKVRVRTPLAGRFNVYNALAALATCGTMGVSPEMAAEALAGMGPVPGRLERVEDPRGGRHLFVDYAHTEDALRNVLQTARETVPGRLVCVFGCGGDRDRSKRPRMGAVASELADLAVATSDNPRSEDPGEIIAEIVAGMDPSKRKIVEVDRAAAIRAALAETRAGDALVVAGKGHETYQEIGGRTIHFDDREALRAALAEGC